MSTPSTFCDLWDSVVSAHADRPFLLFRDQTGEVTTWTYAEYDALVSGVAGAFRARGVGRGSAVHLVLRNCPGFVAAWLAASRLGAWIVPVDPASPVRDLASQISRTAPAVILCAADRLTDVREGAAGRVPHIIGMTETEADLFPGSALLGERVRAADVERPVASDRLALMFTSGTTSEPKGVEVTQANYRVVAGVMADLAGLRPDHRWYVCLPLFHANAQYYCFASAIAAGASVALTARFTASRWPHEVAELEATHASLFAAPIRMILARRRADAPQLDLEHVWFAQNLADGQWSAFADLCGVAPRQLYGMTETLAVVTANPAWAPDPGSIGEPATGRSVALLDPVTRDIAADGEPGVIHVAGQRGVDLFAGYVNNEKANALAFSDALPLPPGTDTWFRTGDLARRAPDGQLVFLGRVDDVIKVAGENVSLTEVEGALAEAPGVLEAAVVAVPDPVRDQVLAAYVVTADPALPPTASDLDAWAAAHLVPAARPRSWALVDALPRTSVGKIRRFKLGSGRPLGDRET